MELNDHFISYIIKKHLGIKKLEKDKYGEVFTPESLIHTILSHFPSNVWSNPNLKWLEPTAGIGNFMMIIYLKLMENLTIWEPDEDKRSKHIIQNMLFMVETNETNVDICKSIFGENANILHEDFLKSNVFDTQFDIIVGNPPFQDDIEGKKRSGNKNKLYERILTKCLGILKSDGYLSFITPDNLFSGGSKIYLELIQNNVLMISFEKTIQDFFPKIQQIMCYFIVKKGSTTTTTSKCTTMIIGNDGTHFPCLLENRPVNPVRDWNVITEQLVHTLIGNTKNNGVYNRGKPLHTYNTSNSDIENDTIYSLIYKPNEKLVLNDKKIVVGIDEKKIVLFLISPNLDFECDFKGIYGVGPNTFYFPIQNEEEGILLETFFKSRVYKTLMMSTKTTRQFIKIACLQYLNINKIIYK
jgi:hypothetical protein